MLNPIQVATYLSVRDTGSFADAGRLLGYTSSAVSQQINALERHTGVTLFERGPQRVIPTAAALSLASRARSSCAALSDLEEEMAQFSSGRRGRLRMGAFPTASLRFVPSALAEFARRRPHVEVVLNEGEPDELIDSLIEGSLDVALVYQYDLVPRQWPDSVVVQEVLREDLRLLMHRSDPDSRLTGSIDVAKLADKTWIASREGTAGSIALSRLCLAAGFSPRIAFRSNNYEVVRGLVSNGLGVALVPALACSADDEIRSLNVSDDAAARRVLALHRLSATSPLIEDAMASLIHAMGRQPA